MRPPAARYLRTCATTLSSYAALAGGMVCLVWLTQQLEAVPTVQWGPWQDIGGSSAPLVIIDAGHGGHDGGAVANGMIEKDIALKLAQRVRFHLVSQGIQVKMTRDKDAFIPLEERSAIANREPHAAAFVSLHLNTSGGATDVVGIETYYSNRKALLRPAASTAWFSRLARSVHYHGCQSSHAEDRGVKERDYFVVLHTRCPAILVECGFLTNSAEAAKLHDADYQDMLAKGLAHGIAEFLKSGPPATAEPPLTESPLPAAAAAPVIGEP